MLVNLTANFTQPRITWEESFNKELSRSSWPVYTLMGGFSWLLIDVERSNKLWTALFLRQGFLLWKANQKKHT